MILHIPLEQFLSLYTYDGTCDGMAIGQYPDIIKQIEEQDPEHKICYIERWGISGYKIWSTEGWIREAKRKQEFDKICKERKLIWDKRVEELTAEQIVTGDKRANALEELLKMGIKL